jgi:hypothetical protein
MPQNQLVGGIIHVIDSRLHSFHVIYFIYLLRLRYISCFYKYIKKMTIQLKKVLPAIVDNYSNRNTKLSDRR